MPAAAATSGTPTAFAFDVKAQGVGGTVTLAGTLDAPSLAEGWSLLVQDLPERATGRWAICCDSIIECDGAGIALLLDIRRTLRNAGAEVHVEGLAPAFGHLLDLFAAEAYDALPESREADEGAIEHMGSAAIAMWEDLRASIAFVGEASIALAAAAMNPRSIRWPDVWRTVEDAGVRALPVTSLIGFLIGLILAFQGAIPLRQFGADIYIASLVGITIIRELGPVMTALALAGRSGSAFAAEIGTMKVNEEINALQTFALDPVRFLVVPRVIAGVLLTPVLSLFATLSGLLGGLVVFLALGYPGPVYMDQIRGIVGLSDYLTGVGKTFVFGLIVAAVGCLRGLQTRTGAAGVGEATTRSVVSGIVLIVVVDGVFAVLFYVLGI